MLQCSECEYFRRDASGQTRLACDPFSTIKEPECLAKWQLIKLNAIVTAHEATAELHRRLAPLQEKMFQHLEREIDDADEADKWKTGSDDEDDDEWKKR